MAERIKHHVVLGMAGHIDHGKTSIVKALTGVDTDRLKEEKERGMTTDLGFAFLGSDITIIDVPGHEKFVKTMVAGVNTVDIALLVIAADDGIMPQTREHLEILNLLKISRGIIALNKTDLVDPDWVSLVIDDIKTLIRGSVMEDAPIIPVSTIQNTGIDELRSAILRAAEETGTRRDKGVFRLPIDRVFTIKGFGTVVAGTILSGKIAPDDYVELLPQKKLLRVRGVQIHDLTVQECTVGCRAAINLGGVERESIERGDCLVEPGFFSGSFMLDGSFTYLKSNKKNLKNRSRIRLHIGTSEVIGRIVLLDKNEYRPGDQGYVQFHCEKAITADTGDRYVIRSFSPAMTIGGGMVLGASPVKHKPGQADVIQHLQRLSKGDPNQILLEFFDRSRYIPLSLEDIAKGCGITKEESLQRIESLVNEGLVVRIGKKRVMKSQNYAGLKTKILTLLGSFHEENPLQFAVSAAKLCQLVKIPVDRLLFDDLIRELNDQGVVHLNGDQVRLSSHTVQLTPKLQEYKEQIEQRFLANLFNPPKFDDIIDDMGEKVHKLLLYLIESGELVQVEKGILFHRQAVTSAKELLASIMLAKKEISLADVRDQFGTTSRAKMVMLLEYFDRIGYTRRVGDVRHLNPLPLGNISGEPPHRFPEAKITPYSSAKGTGEDSGSRVLSP